VDWNLTDLTKVAAISAAVFAVLRAVFGRPLVRNIVNAHRLTWFLVAVGFFVGGAGLLRDHAKSNNPIEWFAPLGALVLEERAAGPVMIAGFAILNTVVILGMLAFCHFRLARDPGSFRKLKQLPKSVQYYASLKGGIDFAVLLRLAKSEEAKPEVVAIGVNRKEIQERLDAIGRKESADARIAKWLELAGDLHREFQSMNAVLEKGGQGGNRRVLLDVQYGGYLLQYVRPPKSGSDVLFLFAVTVLQREVSNRQFEDHFEQMIQAIRNITAGTERM
jgi:hypothetical protein